MKQHCFLTKRISKLFLMCTSILLGNVVLAQEISFGSSGLLGESISQPTSLDFGPDGKLYVAQQNGSIWRYTVERNDAFAGAGSYTVTSSELINLVKENIPNHTDDGLPTAVKQRQVTGILTSGTLQNPILYVTSSDNLVGGGGAGAANDKNLDTNSGVISKLTWNGSSWDKIDLVRGLPRCEENHSTNGMDIFERNGMTYMLVQQGGHANRGAPSNNFVGTPEYLLSGALLIVNLTQLEDMPVYTDPRSNTEYVYDLPTLNDPNKEDITNIDTRFPYPSNHPLYNSTIDAGDPFGGNDGLNQAFAEVGGPVQVFAPGFRNAFDVVVTEIGNIYTFDNGPNGGWGGLPVIYDNTNTYKGDESTTTYEPENGDYIKNEFNEAGSKTHGDALHFVGSINDANGTYYGGHPRPIAAFPSRADLITYKNIEGIWQETARFALENNLVGVSGYFNTSFTINDFPDDPRQGKYLADAINSSEVNILDIINSSTNGICEYTASNFDGALKGSILSTSFNGNIYRHLPNSAGTGYTEKEILFSGFGTIPLDVISLPENHPFAGTVWVANYVSNSITIFEPSDSVCLTPDDVDFDATADYDNDGYSNQDEIDNGTNICSGGSTPKDNDKDFLSDLNDPDDDNDAIFDNMDPFAIDPNNGTTTNLPVEHPFLNNNPGTGFFGLGFTGLMLDPTGNTDYLAQFNEENLSFGGAAGKASVDLVTNGDAVGTNNNQENGFQFGVNVDINSAPFTIQSRIESPFFGVDGASTTPVNFQSVGIFIGNGDQDNYLKITLGNGSTNTDTENGVEVGLENAGVFNSEKYDIPNILSGSAVDFFINVNPAQNSAQPYVSLDGGNTLIILGEAISLPQSFLDPADSRGLAIGLIATAFGENAVPFSAIWDFINVTEDQPGTLVNTPENLDFGALVISDDISQQNLEISNLSGPTEPAITITEINFTGVDNSLFSSEITLPAAIGSGGKITIPVTIAPSDIAGNKTATLEISHSGPNSPLLIPITAVISDDFVPTIRINAGSAEFAATDGGPNWVENASSGAISNTIYTVNTGNLGTFNIKYAGRHNSIPDYIDEATFDAIFAKERWDSGSSPEMEFKIPVPNGNHVVNLFLGNGYSGTTSEGSRIYDIMIEGVIQRDNLDLITEFGGTKIGGMLSFPVSVTDGEMNITFLHEVENPLINAIEILSQPLPSTDINVTAIEDQNSTVNKQIDLAVAVSGGDPAKNFTYTIEGQPDGIAIEPTNGHIFGTIAPSALDGGIAHNGIHNVMVTVSQEGLDSVITEFVWTIIPNLGIAITTPPDQTNSEGDIVSLQIEATGGSNPTYSATGLPPLLTIDDTTGLISGTISTQTTSSGAYEEENGVVVIEAESANLEGSNWALENRNGATAIVAKTNHFHDQNGSALNYDIQFNTPGIYRIVWRSDFSGTNPTDQNDSWIKMENNEDTQFFAQGCYTCGESNMITNLKGPQLKINFPKGSNEVTESTTPKGSGGNGWFKGYRSGVSGWNWSTLTSDGISYPIYVYVTTPGIHTLQLSERSKGHIIDKFALYKVNSGTSYTTAKLDEFPISERASNIEDPEINGIYDVNITVQDSDQNASTNFLWTITPPVAPTAAWIDKDENENYVARHECSFVQAGNKFIMFGGRESAKRLDVYDYEANTWNQGGAAPVEFNHFQAVTYKGLVWVIGAFQTNAFPNETPADHIYMYNPASQQWIQGIEIPESRRRGGAGLVIHNEKFYVIGGNTIGHNGGYIPWFDEYDPATGIWTTLTDAPHARDHFHATVLDGKLYAAGGRLSGGPGGTFAPVIPEVDVYDFASNTWSVLDQNLPTPRAGVGVVTFENEIYVMGGETSDMTSAYDTVEAYNPQTNTWETKTSMNHARHGTQAIVSGNGIFIAGGSQNRGGGNQKNMEVYKQDDPEGEIIIDSSLTPDSTSKVFSYTEAQGSVPLEIILSNTGGNTAKYIKSVTLTGANYSLSEVYENIFLNIEQELMINVVLDDTTIPQSNGTITVTFDNNQEINVTLSGTQGLPQEESIIYRINAGGLEIPDAPTNWAPDLARKFYGSGVTGDSSPYVNSEGDSRSFSRPNPEVFQNSTNYRDEMFQTMRFSIYTLLKNQQWDFPVANGSYNVVLLFNEMWPGAKTAGARIFDVSIENKIVLDDFDITATYGWQTAGVASFKINVNDGNLDINLERILGNPMLGGIEITKLIDVTETPISDSDNSGIVAINAFSPEQVNEILKENIRIYPVPASEKVTIAIDNTNTDDLIKEIQLVDPATGKVLKTAQNIAQSEIQFDISDLEQGIYIANILSVNGGTTIEKIAVF